jgi:hypothetical protein
MVIGVGGTHNAARLKLFMSIDGVHLIHFYWKGLISQLVSCFVINSVKIAFVLYFAIKELFHSNLFFRNRSFWLH